MKSRDFFLPKIAHSNPEVRIVAIKGEENIELLKNVIKIDSDQRVVEAAKSRIEELSETVV